MHAHACTLHYPELDRGLQFRWICKLKLFFTPPSSPPPTNVICGLASLFLTLRNNRGNVVGSVYVYAVDVLPVRWLQVRLKANALT